MNHSIKPLFAFNRMVEDMLRGYIAKPTDDWIEWLAFDQMARVPDDWVAPRWRCADLIWSIPFHEDSPSQSATHMIVILKFENTVVQDMGERIGRQVDLLRLEINRRHAYGAPDKPPVLVPVVIYTGDEPWHETTKEQGLVFV